MHAKLKIALFILLTSCTFNAFATVSITRTSAPDFYIDTGTTPKLLGQYVSYQVTNTSGAAYEDVWVKISNFTDSSMSEGTSVTLGVNALDKANLGSLANNETKTAYFYLVADAAIGTTNTDQEHDIQVYDGTPASGALIPAPSATTTTFAFASIIEPGEAASNKVNSTLVGPTSPGLGAEVILTVVGDTGSLTGARIFSLSPATYADWPADTYQLSSTEVTFVGDHSAEVMTDEMYRILSGGSSTYTAVYVFRAVNISQQPVTISPVANITNGTLKHTNTSNFNSFPPVQPVENLLQIKDKTVTPTLLSSGGGTVTYTVSIENTSSSESAELNDIIDTLSANMIYVTGTSTFGGVAINDPNISGSVLTWQRTFTIPANTIVDLSYQVDIPATDGAYGNSVLAHIGDVVIDSTMGDTSDSSPESVFVFVGTPEADLVTVKTVDDANPNENQNITYSVTVTNNGPGEPGNIVISDILPAGVTYSSSTVSVGSYDFAGDVWTISSTLGLGDSVALTVEATVNASTAGTTLTNTSVVTSNQTDPTAVGDILSASVTVNDFADADLVTTISVSDATPDVGQQITYTINVTNDGPGAATDVTLLESLPAGLTYSATTSATHDSYNGTDTWTIGSLAVNETATLSLVADLTAVAGTLITNNTASATGIETDPSTSGDILSAVLTVNSSTDADLVVSKTVSNTTPSESDAIQYTITLTNNGPATANNISVTDFLPTGVDYVGFSAAPTATTYTFASGNWTVPSLAAGATETLTINVTVGLGTSGSTITNTIIGVNADENDPDATGNILSANFTVQVDTTPPTVVITLADSILTSGETSLVTFDFSEVPVGFDNNDITAPNGTLSAVFVDIMDATLYTATFTPTDDVLDDTNIISVGTDYVDGAGNTGVAASSANFTIDTTDIVAPLTPTVDLLATSDLGISDTDNITSDTTPTFRVSLDQTGAVATNTIESDVVKLFEGATQVGTVTLMAGDITNGYVDITSSAVSAGSLSFTATVTDQATTPNVSNASSVLAVSLDTTPPSVAILLADDALIKGETSLVTFTFSEEVGGFANAVVTVANGILSTVTVDGVDAKIYTATFTPTDNLIDVSNIMSVSTAYTDVAGNAGTAVNSGNYTIDTIDTTAALAPSVDLVAASDLGASNTDNFTSDTTPTFRVTFDQNGAATTDTVADDIVKLYEGVTQVGTATLTMTDITNGYVDVTSSALSAGSLSFTATVTDTSANVSSPSSALAVSLDTAAPTLTVVMADTALIKGETSNVTFTFSEVPSGFAVGDVTAANGGLTLFTVTADPKIYTALFTPTDNLVDAINIMSVSTAYTDEAGNTGTAANSDNYTIDTTDTTAALAPSVDLVDASDLGASSTDNFTSDTTPTFRVTFDQSGAAATDTAADDIIKLYEGVTQVGTATISTTDITNGYVDVTSSALSAGSLSFTATVTDTSANVSDPSSALAVSLDTTEPIAPTITPQTTSDATPVISGTAEADATVTIIVGGATYTATANSSGDWTLDTATVSPDSGTLNLVDGVNNISVTSADVAGNSNTSATNGTLTFIAFTDADNDGIPDSVECPAGPPLNATNCPDSDGDGTPNYLDTDSDNDGISDAVEAGSDPANPTDTDGGGNPDYIDADSDNDGILDADEKGLDSDGDGIPDYVDLPGNDFDGDGIPDSVECPVYPNCVDTDSGGQPDYTDIDSDNDGISDTAEAGLDPTRPIDTDGDGIPDYRDTDSDNDGTSDADEVGANPLSPIDTDGDGIPDYLDYSSGGPGSGDSDGDGIGDGIADSIECVLYPLCADSDADGIPDYMEIDSDNDGISDAIEAGVSGVDSDVDGIDDTFDVDATVGLDLNNDGIDDTRPLDSDGDGLADYQDADSDNDGITDAVEGLVDNDFDGIPDYVDVESSGLFNGGDSDGDGIDDAIECPTYPTDCDDIDADGIPDYLDDNHDDGPLGNIDGDSRVNYLDPDDDGDGVPDAIEDPNLDGDNNPATNPVDTDGDGIPDYQDTDSDNDGSIDTIDSGLSLPLVDTDNDGIIDIYDADADGVGGTDSGKVDANNDGIDDAIKPADVDGDGIPDMVDTDTSSSNSDSDGDGIPDRVECVSYPACADSDGDGQPDYTEVDSDNDNIDDRAEFGALASGNAVDSDGDGVADYRDTDSDNDGASDAVEGLIDNDGDGIPDYVDVESSGLAHGGDSDGDGVEDFAECPNYPACPDADGDNVPDYMDADSQPYNPTDVIETGLRGIGATAPVSLLLIAGLLLLVRSPRRYFQRILFVMVGLLSLQVHAEKEFDTGWYLGGGAGLTELKPDTKNTGYAISDGSNIGYKLFLGYDFDEEFSLEIQQSFLGKAKLNNQGNVLLNENAEITYDLPGVSLLWYGWHDAEDDVYTYRHGWQAFILAGISFIKNTADVPYEQVNSAQFHLGVGVEYGWDNGFAVRLAAESYDEDALFVYTSLLYRFGYKSKRECYRVFC